VVSVVHPSEESVVEGQNQVRGGVMNRVSVQTVAITKVFGVVVLLVATIFPAMAFGQAKKTKLRGFWVAGTAAVTVKPDEAAVFLVIRGSGRSATDALTQNERITRQVEQALDELGLKEKYRLTENHFSSGGFPTPAFRPFNPGVLQSSGCFEVKKYVFVTFNEADLSKPGFDQILAETIDGLTSAGAQQSEMLPQFAQTRITSPVLFTVKDPGPALLEAVRQAQERARALGQEVARDSGVKLHGIIDARVNRPLEVSLPGQQEPTILDELHVQYYSSTKEGVTIPATFAVEYSAK
jgi:uncharacterized protein YggE